MRRLLGTLALVGLCLVTAIPSASAQAFPYCEPGQAPRFLFEFTDLKARLGAIMGEPVECEHVNPDNGDVLQHTTTGLAYHRKTTDTPSFTDGRQHWALTDAGLVTWIGSSVDPPASAVAVSPPGSGAPSARPAAGPGAQAQPSPPAPAAPAAQATPPAPAAPTPPTPAPAAPACEGFVDLALDEWSVDSDGRAQFNAQLRNICRVPMDVEVNVGVIDADTGQLVAVAPSAYVRNLQPGQPARVATSVEGLSPTGRYRAELRTFSTLLGLGPNSRACYNVGASRCLLAEGWTGGAIWLLGQSPAGQPLVRTAADAGLFIAQTPVPGGAWVAFDQQRGVVTIDPALNEGSYWERAAVLAYALRIAADVQAGIDVSTRQGCLTVEANAFRTLAAVWSGLWSGQLPRPTNPIQQQLNEITVAASGDVEAALPDLLGRVRRACPAA